MVRGGLDIVQPDLARCGGFSQGRRIAQAAFELGRECVPHAFSTGILIAASLQIVASMPRGTYCEYTVAESHDALDVLASGFEFADGFVRVPIGPGARHRDRRGEARPPPRRLRRHLGSLQDPARGRRAGEQRALDPARPRAARRPRSRTPRARAAGSARAVSSSARPTGAVAHVPRANGSAFQSWWSNATSSRLGKNAPQRALDVGRERPDRTHRPRSRSRAAGRRRRRAHGRRRASAAPPPRRRRARPAGTPRARSQTLCARPAFVPSASAVAAGKRRLEAHGRERVDRQREHGARRAQRRAVGQARARRRARPGASERSSAP